MELFYKLSNIFGLGSDYLIINQLAENINRYKRIEIHEDLDLRDFYLSVTKSLQNMGITNESIIGLAKATQRWGETTKKIHDTEKDDAEKIGGVVIKALNEIMQRCGDENRTSINLDQLNPTLATFNKLYHEFVRTEKRSKHKVCELIQERMRTIIDLFIEINFGSIVSLDKEAKKQATKALNRLKKQFSSENDKPKVVTKIIDEKIEAINKEEKVTTT